jgi:uncharacterized protein (TIGR00369 family)
MPDMKDLPRDPAALAAWFQEDGDRLLPGLLDIEVIELGPGRGVLALNIQTKHLASNGYLHAGTVVTLADSACGYGCVASLPENAIGFTTIETKSNHVGTALSGRITAESTLIHGGRTTQVWDATVLSEATSKPIAFFRCTQMILYPR